MSLDFPDFTAPTKLTYLDGRPSEIHLRKCKFVQDEDGSSKEKIFDQSIIAIGAMDDNDLIVNDDSVSRHHCQIKQSHNGYTLIDLNSTNGTFIDRVRIKEAYLRSGCTIQLGKVKLKFYFADEKIPILPSKNDRLGQIIGQSIKMREIYGIIEKIAPTDTTVVLEGATGTGKEIVAQTIHQLSKRAKNPILVFDCGAIPPNLIESELFGHEKGSFTGAIMTRKGLFELADGGTIFLDELGELSLELQPKLLRALEQREIKRVGSSTTIKVDVRVIAATNRSLEEEVRAGRFRQDLYYRLSVVRICLPLLKERTEDIPLLINHFINNHSIIRNPDGSPKVQSISTEVMELLCAHSWPGNIRELLNVVERAASFAEHGKIQATDLPENIRLIKPTTHAAVVEEGVSFKDAKEKWIATFERDYLISLLKKNGGNISHAARDAAIDRKYFRKLMNKYNIEQ